MYQIIRPYETHDAIPDIRKFFNSFGIEFKNNECRTYDRPLVDAVNTLKASAGLHSDGVINNAVWQQIDSITPQKAVQADLRLSLDQIDKEFIIRDKTAVEAGYVNNPDDRGGETNHGITKAVADKYKTKLIELFDWNGLMADLTKEMAFWIYTVEYWDKMRCGSLHNVHPLLADKMFDIGINAGVHRASKWLQEILTVMNNKGKLYPDLNPDGVIGDITIKRLAEYVDKRGSRSIPRLHLALFCRQGEHYINISLKREKNETFTYGWYDRMEHNLDVYYQYLWNPDAA